MVFPGCYHVHLKSRHSERMSKSHKLEIHWGNLTKPFLKIIKVNKKGWEVTQFKDTSSTTSAGKALITLLCRSIKTSKLYFFVDHTLVPFLDIGFLFPSDLSRPFSKVSPSP